MNHWPRYQSHKIVRAAKIVEITRDADDNVVIWVDPGTGNRERFEPSVSAMVNTAAVGGYAVFYDDEHKSLSPQGPFEEGYRLIGE